MKLSDIQNQEHSRSSINNLVNVIKVDNFSHSRSQHYNVLRYKNETN